MPILCAPHSAGRPGRVLDFGIFWQLRPSWPVQGSQGCGGASGPSPKKSLQPEAFCFLYEVETSAGICVDRFTSGGMEKEKLPGSGYVRVKNAQL